MTSIWKYFVEPSPWVSFCSIFYPPIQLNNMIVRFSTANRNYSILFHLSVSGVVVAAVVVDAMSSVAVAGILARFLGEGGKNFRFYIPSSKRS